MSDVVSGIRPGWYPDGHGSRRWWDGAGWTEFTEAGAPGSVLAATAHGTGGAVSMMFADDPDLEPGRDAGDEPFESRARVASASPRPWRAALVVAACTGLCALLLGIAIGASGAVGSPATDPSKTPAFVALTAKLARAQADRDRLLRDANAAAEAQQTLAARTKQLDALSAKLDARATALDARLAAVTEREAAAPPAAATGGASSGTSTSGGTSGSSAADGSGAAVYYPNCAAVRAAGSAPIRRGEPGYSAHLDRDGDGIACE